MNRRAPSRNPRWPGFSGSWIGCGPVGQIWLEGREVRFAHPAEATRAGIALVTEDRKRLGVFSEMTVGENITMCSLAQAATAGVLSRRSERRLAKDAIRELGVKTSG